VSVQEATPQNQVKSIGSGIKPASKVYWLRFLLAIIAGISNTALHISTTVPLWGDLAPFVGIMVGASIYGVSLLIVRYVFKYGELELKGKHKDITLGGGTFIVVWVMTMVLVNSLFSS